MNKSSPPRRGASAAAPVALRLLGEPRVFLGGVDATPRSKRGRALVAYLALTPGHSASRSRLADLFWGDRGEAQARGSLRQCLLEVRGAIGPELLLAGRDDVALGEGWTCDVAMVDALIGMATPANIADAVEQAGREPLLGTLFVSDAFDEWLSVTRSAFDTRLAEAARRGLRLAIDAGDDDSARRIADHYLLRDPGDEEATVLAMQADAARGAAPVAHRRFQRLRDYLASELGAAPGPAAVAALAALTAPTPLPVAVAEPAGGPPLLVVGPFTETGLVGDLRHIGGGVREEVVSGLSRFRDIRVLVEDRLPSLTEAPLYGSSGRAYALTANLRVAEGRMRVTPVLTRLADRAVVWSQPVDVASVGLERAIDTMVDRIIGAAAPSVERDAVRQSTSADVYDRYLAAQYASFPTNDHGVAQRAARELEAVIAEAPNLAVAYPPLIRLYNTNYAFTIAGVRCDSERERAFELARTAFQLDRGHAFCYTAMGWCQLWHGNFDAAHAILQQTLEINPYHSTRLKEAAFGMVFLGDRALSDMLLARSLEIDPLPNDGFFEDLGLLRLMQGKAREATSYLDLLIAPSIWGELYAALAARSIHRADGLSRLAGWIDRIAARWRGDGSMDAATLIDWVGYHHPFRERQDFDAFMTMVADAVRDRFRREAA